MDAWNPGWKSSNILKTTELRTVLLLGAQLAPEADVLDVWGDLHVIILWVAAIPCWLHVKACHHWTQPSRPKVNPNKTLLITGLWLTYSGDTFEAGEIRMILKLPLRKYARPPTPHCHAVAPPPPQPCGSLAWRHGALPATCLPARLPCAASAASAGSLRRFWNSSSFVLSTSKKLAARSQKWKLMRC